MAKRANVSIMLLGESSVGKTALIRRYTRNEFGNEFFSTVGTDFAKKDIIDDGKKITAKIWDTAGQERFKTITNSFYKQADGILLIYDVHKVETFKKLTTWINNINSNANNRIPKYLIANKIDLDDEREVKKEVGEAFAEEYDMKHFGTSAKTGENVVKVFEQIIKQAHTVKQRASYSPSFTITSESSKEANKHTCCH